MDFPFNEKGRMGSFYLENKMVGPRPIVEQMDFKSSDIELKFQIVILQGGFVQSFQKTAKNAPQRY